VPAHRGTYRPQPPLASLRATGGQRQTLLPGLSDRTRLALSRILTPGPAPDRRRGGRRVRGTSPSLPGGYSSAVGDAPAKMRASPRRARTRPLRTEGVARTAAAQISLWGGNNGPLSTEVKSVRPGRRRPRFCRICRRSRSPRGAIVSSGHRYSLCDSLDDEQEAQGETPPWQKEQSWCTASTVRSLEMDESGQRPPQEGGEGNAAPLRDSSSVATVETSSDPRHPRPLGKNAISGGVEGARIEARRRSPLRRVESAGSGRSRARERVIGDDVSVPRTVSSVAATQLGARGQSDDSRSLNRDAARARRGSLPETRTAAHSLWIGTWRVAGRGQGDLHRAARHEGSVGPRACRVVEVSTSFLRLSLEHVAAP
jgi:hypothetical protein